MELRRWGWKLGVRRILGDGDDECWRENLRNVIQKFGGV